MEKLSMVSFLQNGHPYHLYTYKDIKGVPDKVILKDAKRIISEENIFKYRNYNSYAGFSNLFRYKLLLEKGGFWVDTDVVCLKPFQFISDYVFASENYVSYEKKTITQVTNCVIKVPAGSKIMGYCYEQSLAKNPNELKWGETGPKLISKAVLKQFKMHSQVQNPTTFCPIPYQFWKFFIADNINLEDAVKITELTNDSYSIHLYNEMWRRNNVNKNESFAPDSIFEKLKKRYLIK
jgi:mannosyltransferase OCH1-like enzyme